MLKLYRFSAQKKEYWETWENEDHHVAHWGELGTNGQTKGIRDSLLKKSHKKVQEEIDNLIENGYSEAEEEFTVLIEYNIEGMGTASDVEKRHRLENRMNETLGWSGLGNCDGGSIGSGTMEVCNFVVDFEVAKKVIEADLAGTEFECYARIYCEELEQ